ncbi:MAG: hypothetical protein GY832_16545 [Chloroflexi bacterium]|nr:hypothetical protein [Chloroflexota bacterium]
MHNKKWPLWVGLLFVGVGTLLILLGWSGVGRSSTAIQSPTVRPTLTPEPIIPTRTPMGQVIPSTLITATSISQQSPPLLQRVEGDGTLWLGRPRWGVGITKGPISQYDLGTLSLGWYLDWTAQIDPPRPDGVTYAQMIRLSGGVLRPSVEEIADIARANPSSLWLVGNEPDVIWQDNTMPATYARLYHDAHTAIKDADSTAQVAIGGVSQPTPLRLAYLDAIMEAYRQQFGAEMPVDVWNVHNFILQEKRGAWGVDIPPGLPDAQGMLYSIDDGGSLAIFRQQIVDFRRWMTRRGYQNTSLIVSEYGILMPEDYGFPPERVTAFMTGTFDFFLTATDPTLGYPADDYRLVQMWCWYSLDDAADHYPTGNLLNPQTGKMTAIGEVWAAYVE